MAFAVESIETSEQRAEFASFAFLRPGTKLPLEAMTWVVDRTRGLYIVNRGGGSLERPYCFQLASSGGVDVRFEGTIEAKGEMDDRGLEVWWHIDSLSIPKSQQNRVAEICDWIREGLTVYGDLGDTKYTKKVHVELPIPALVEVPR